MFPERKKQNETNKHPGFLPGDAFCPKAQERSPSRTWWFCWIKEIEIGLLETDAMGIWWAEDSNRQNHRWEELQKYAQGFSNIFFNILKGIDKDAMRVEKEQLLERCLLNDSQSSHWFRRISVSSSQRGEIRLITHSSVYFYFMNNNLK